MADLDTRSKRASSVQILAPWMLAPVLPDGSIAQADRQHIAWSYSGILATAAEAVMETVLGTVLAALSPAGTVEKQPSPAGTVRTV